MLDSAFVPVMLPPAGRSSSQGKELPKQLWKGAQEISEAREVYDTMSLSKPIVAQSRGAARQDCMEKTEMGQNETDFRESKMAADQDQEITPEYRKRVAAEYADGYPTRETLAEFLEAHKNGGEGAIMALLRKRRAALNQTEDSAPDP